MQRLRMMAGMVVLVATLVAPAMAHDWNEAQITWQSFDEGLALAKKSRKPVCLIFFTETCPHCVNYAKLFHDPKVVAEAKHFVMIHQANGADPAVTQRFAPDGAYIPRTFFLSPDGELVADIHAPRDRYKYFYPESDPAGVLAGMAAARAKFK